MLHYLKCLIFFAMLELLRVICFALSLNLLVAYWSEFQPTLSPAGPVIHELDTVEQIEDCEANPEETSEKETFLPSE
jgi:hypothetical protein